MKAFTDPASLKADTDRARRAAYSPHGSAPSAHYLCERCGFQTPDAQVIFAHTCRCSACGSTPCACDPGGDEEPFSDLDGGCADGRDYW